VRRESWPHPVIVDGKLYLREQERLYCYDLRPRPARGADEAAAAASLAAGG
jgi:hypothetical protein